MEFLNTPEKRDRRMMHIPMGRFGEAIEQAKAALFRAFQSLTCTYASDNPLFLVATDESSYITVSKIVISWVCGP
jgi:hypothetical protein